MASFADRNSGKIRTHLGSSPILMVSNTASTQTAVYEIVTLDLGVYKVVTEFRSVQRMQCFTSKQRRSNDQVVPKPDRKSGDLEKFCIYVKHFYMKCCTIRRTAKESKHPQLRIKFQEQSFAEKFSFPG